MIRNFNFLLYILLFYCTTYLSGHYFCIFILLSSSSAFVTCFIMVEHSWDVILHFLHPSRILLEVERYFVVDVLRLGEFWVCLITTLIPFSILFLYFPYQCNSVLFKKKRTSLYVITMFPICALTHVRMYEDFFPIIKYLPYEIFDVKAVGSEVLYILFMCQFFVQYVVFFSWNVWFLYEIKVWGYIGLIGTKSKYALQILLTELLQNLFSGFGD